MLRVLFLFGIYLSTIRAQEIAIKGYDPVAYFTQNKPVKGHDSISIKLSGVRWLFSSVENQMAFNRTPEKFMPQFSGFCAYAAAHNYIYEADPRVWTIVDGRLYLNYSEKVRSMWEVQRDSMIVAGHKNWINLKDSKK